VEGKSRARWCSRYGKERRDASAYSILSISKHLPVLKMMLLTFIAELRVLLHDGSGSTWQLLLKDVGYLRRPSWAVEVLYGLRVASTLGFN